MLKTWLVRTFSFSAVAVLISLFAANPLHAQQNVLSLGIGNVAVNSGGQAMTTSTLLASNLADAMNIQGVSGNGGSATYSCVINVPDGTQASLFSSTVTSNYYATSSYTFTKVGTYTASCTATYMGTYANTTVTTPTLTIVVS